MTLGRKPGGFRETPEDGNRLTELAEDPGSEPRLVTRVIIPGILVVVMPTSNSFFKLQEMQTVLNLQRRGGLIGRKYVLWSKIKSVSDGMSDKDYGKTCRRINER
jgi:hypothetical protein